MRSYLIKISGASTYDLFHDLARGVQVDQALVNLELIAIPCLGTFTKRLQTTEINSSSINRPCRTYSLASGNLQDFSGEADRALNAELLVLGSVDKVAGD